MKNLKSLLTSGLIVASVTFINASNCFDTFRNVDVNNLVVVPSNNHLEKNTSAKFIAKQLVKSASIITVLGSTSDVLERYSATNGTIFSSIVAPTESFAIVSMKRSDRGDVIRVKVESNKDIQVYFNTVSGMGVPFEVVNLGNNEVFISSAYSLPNGDYNIRVKTKSGEKKIKFKAEQKDVLGKI